MAKLTVDQTTVVKETIRSIRRGIRVTKVTCTRSVKGKYGDAYVGFSAGWHTTQDDMGGATDAQISSEETAPWDEDRGLTLNESKLAAYLVAMEVDLQAHDHAMAGSTIWESDRQTAHEAIRANYNRLVVEQMFRSGLLKEDKA